MKSSSLDRTIRRAFSALCWNIGTPLAYKASLALERGDWAYLTSVRVEIGRYTCPRALSGDLQIAAFFKKFPGFDLGIDLKEKAVSAFYESERQCYLSNERLAPLLSDREIYGSGLSQFITEARKEVRRVLGRCPSRDELRGRFGPGSTFRDVGSLITVPDKMSSSYTLTRQARPFLRAWDQTAWSRYAAAGLVPLQKSALIGLDRLVGQDEISPGLTENDIDKFFAPLCEEVVRGNRFTTVPKDARKNRGICIEPSINVFYQLGIGQWMTQQMKVKIDWVKESQQEFHKLLARLGSLTRLQATLDLSNASDTVCSNLVKLLLPTDWFSLLFSLRSPYTFIGGKWVRLEKFSSMGNGFTFELETLLFHTITKIVARTSQQPDDWFGRTVSVFGDDIICPTDVAEDVIAALTFFGFSLNVEKSYYKGEFRESCGGDYFRGLDMRPHYLKEDPHEPHQFIALANGLARFGIRHTQCGGPNVARTSWLRVLDALPSGIRSLRGPKDLGDLLIHDEESKWNYAVRGSIRYFRVWRPVAFGRTPWHHFRPGVVLASALYGTGDGASYNKLGWRLSVADGVLSRVNGEYVAGYRFGRVSFS